MPQLTAALPRAPLLAHRPVRVLSRPAELADSWDQLAIGSGSPMHHYAWVSACAELFSKPSDVHLVVLGSPEDPAAIAPLVRAHGPVPRLELLGLRHLHEPTDFVYRDAGAAAALAAAVAPLGLPLFLERVPAESATVCALKTAWRGRGVVVSRPALGCPFLELAGGWADTEPPLEAGRRSDLRRARRRAEGIGPLSCQIVSPGPSDLDPLLDELFRVESTGWKGRHGTALASDLSRGAFYRRYAAAASRTGVLRLCYLRIGERTAAVQFALEAEGRFWLLKIGYDPAFARCSPGQLLLWETVRYAARRGLRTYEFLGGPEPWIRVWTERIRPCVAVRAYPARPLGMAALAIDVAKSGWGRVRRSVGRSQ